jgi:hypothetical protein
MAEVEEKDQRHLDFAEEQIQKNLSGGFFWLSLLDKNTEAINVRQVQLTQQAKTVKYINEIHMDWELPSSVIAAVCSLLTEKDSRHRHVRKINSLAIGDSRYAHWKENHKITLDAWKPMIDILSDPSCVSCVDILQINCYNHGREVEIALINAVKTNPAIKTLKLCGSTEILYDWHIEEHQKEMHPEIQQALRNVMAARAGTIELSFNYWQFDTVRENKPLLPSLLQAEILVLDQVKIGTHAVKAVQELLRTRLPLRILEIIIM